MGERTQVIMEFSVSVLVPVYNVEPYLLQCLDSLRAQKLPGVEIILLDDGSTDGSGAMLDDFAAHRRDALVVHKPNSGYGATLNRGLEQARGRYVAILEPDDFVAPAMYRDCFRIAEKHNLDMVRTNYSAYCAGRKRKIKNYGGYPSRALFDPASCPGILGTAPAIWAGLYRRSWLREQGIDFLETPGASFQDTGFSYKTWMGARRVMLLSGGYVRYRTDNQNSSVKSAAKVFALCQEFASVEAFMDTLPPERIAHFAGAYQQAKFGNYRWNYNRIDPSQREEFVARIVQEFAEADERGLLDWDAFKPGNRQLLAQAMASPRQFCATHSTMPWEP